jgi:hypothetical protein
LLPDKGYFRLLRSLQWTISALHYPSASRPLRGRGVFLRPLVKAELSSLPKKNAPRCRERRSLPDKGSNLDIQIQNLTYYHYTIGQNGTQNYIKKPDLLSYLISFLYLHVITSSP